MTGIANKKRKYRISGCLNCIVFLSYESIKKIWNRKLFYTFTSIYTNHLMKKFFIFLALGSLFMSWAQDTQRTTDLYVAFYAEVPSMRAEVILATFDLSAEKAIPLSEEKFKEMESEALRISGDDSSIKNLQNIYRVLSEELSDNDLQLLAKEIELFPEVRYYNF